MFELCATLSVWTKKYSREGGQKRLTAMPEWNSLLPKSSADQHSLRRFPRKSCVTSLGWISFDLSKSCEKLMESLEKWVNGNFASKEIIYAIESLFGRFPNLVEKSNKELWSQKLLSTIENNFLPKKFPEIVSGCHCWCWFAVLILLNLDGD